MREPSDSKVTRSFSPLLLELGKFFSVVLTEVHSNMAVGLRAWGGNAVNKGPKKFLRY